MAGCGDHINEVAGFVKVREFLGQLKKTIDCLDRSRSTGSADTTV